MYGPGLSVDRDVAEVAFAFDPEHAEWDALGFGFQHHQAWVAAGGTLTDARRWTGDLEGLFKADEAVAWFETLAAVDLLRSFPETRRQYLENASLAARWEFVGYSPEDAARWIREGYVTEEVIRGTCRIDLPTANYLWSEVGGRDALSRAQLMTDGHVKPDGVWWQNHQPEHTSTSDRPRTGS